MELRAVAAASAAQINAQIKNDELALKKQQNKEAAMEEILRRIAEAEKRIGPEALDGAELDMRQIAPPPTIEEE